MSAEEQELLAALSRCLDCGVVEWMHRSTTLCQRSVMPTNVLYAWWGLKGSLCPSSNFTCPDCSDRNCGGTLAKSWTAAWHCSSEDPTQNWYEVSILRAPLELLIAGRSFKYVVQICPLQLRYDVEHALLAICICQQSCRALKTCVRRQHQVSEFKLKLQTPQP